MTVGEVPQEISLNKIQENPQNPRKYFDEVGIQELANNIEAVGLLQPIRVRAEGVADVQAIAPRG